MSGSDLPSGRFVLRLPPALHARLADTARERGISLNEHCLRSLARAEAVSGGPLADAVAHALEQLGCHVAGMAVFGSFARGEAGPGSDVDLLVALEPGVPITRSLYAPWDEVDLRVDGHEVAPHFVALAVERDPISGFWAEVALDGSVVWDPDLILTRELVRIRRAIMSGVLVRRSAGGRTWWTAA